jgi:hypothetical protein
VTTKNLIEDRSKKMSARQKFMFSFFSFVIITSLFSIASAGPEREAAKGVKTGVISGRILTKDAAPLAWGEVMLYDASAGPPPMPDQYERTPDISRSSDADGRFKIDLPPGKYYLGAIKRMSNERFGPPQEGDYVFRHADEKGKPKEYVIKAGSLLDVGTISGAVPVRAQDLVKRAITTGMEGVVIDTDGRPIDDAVVLAFVNPSFKGKPLFISDKTGKDGKYILRLTEGTFYLRVRNSFTSGPPEPGQIVGYYGDGTPAPVTVKAGEVQKGIDFRVILFGGRGPRNDMIPQTQ